MHDGPVDRATNPGTVMARLERPRADERTALAVLADPHVSTRASGTSKLLEHTERHLRNAVADIAGRDVDAVACVGDLTKDGEPWNYDAVDGILADLDAPFLGVPGNHDVRKEGDEHETLPLAAFEARYTPGGLPFAERVGGVDVIGLNSAGGDGRLADTHAGEVPRAQVEWLDGALADAAAPIVLLHHNLPAMAAQLDDHREAVEPEMAEISTLRNADALVDTVAAHDVPLVLSGHLHHPSAARTRGVRELMVPTTCSFPQSYLLVEVGPAGTTVRLVPVADFDGLREAYRRRRADSATARGFTAMASVRLAAFPLVDER